MSKIIAESKYWKIEREHLDWDTKFFSIHRKGSQYVKGEIMIVTEDELKELLSFNNVPLE